MTAAPLTAARKRTRTFLKYGLSIGITALFLYLAFRGTNFRELWASFRDVNYWWILLYFAVLMTSHFLRALRWRYMLEPVKANISIRNLFSGVMVGYMMNNVLPRAGELVRPYTLGRLENIPKSAALGTIVVERIIDTLTFVVLVVLMPVLYEGPLEEHFPWLNSAGLIVSAAAGGLLAILVIMMVKRSWTDVLLKLIGRILPAKLATRVEDMTHAFLDGSLFLTRPGRFLLIFVLSVMIWALYALMVYVAFIAYGLQGLGFPAAVVILAISSIGMALPTPGGTGTYHILVSQALSQLFAVDPTVALSAATVTHATGFVGVTLIGLYYFIKDNVRVSEAEEAEVIVGAGNEKEGART